MQPINTFAFASLLLLLPSDVAADEGSPVSENTYPLSTQDTAELTKSFEAVLNSTPILQSAEAVSTDVHSRRGDALFFLARFKESVTEYQTMVKQNPTLDESHWRLGIALFFADQPALAVAQFEKYHSFDNVDRENGIWRYLSQYKATDAATAKKELIRYDKDDREPFPAVYKLFDGSFSPEQALANIPKNLSPDEHEKQLFYTELYIGMHLVVKKQLKEAEKHLRLAVSRKWPRNAGFGPNYMWHVGRVQLDLLLKKSQPNTSN